MGSEANYLPGTLALLIMNTLSAGPMHGHGIGRSIARTSRILHIEEGSLYPALYRLEQRGWLRSEWRLTSARRRARYYSLTPKGERRLRVETAAWREFAAAIGNVLRGE